jgi:hypothetical protein
MRIGSDRDVAEILGISDTRLKARISAGAPMPPYMRVPGSKFRRWDLDQVEVWMATFTVGAAAGAVPDPGMQIIKRGRGRPKKINTIGTLARDM